MSFYISEKVPCYSFPTLLFFASFCDVCLSDIKKLTKFSYVIELISFSSEQHHKKGISVSSLILQTMAGNSTTRKRSSCLEPNLASFFS